MIYNPFLDDEIVNAQRIMRIFEGTNNVALTRLAKELELLQSAREAFDSLNPLVRLAYNLHYGLYPDGHKLAPKSERQSLAERMFNDYSSVVGRIAEDIFAVRSRCLELAKLLTTEFSEEQVNNIVRLLFETRDLPDRFRS